MLKPDLIVAEHVLYDAHYKVLICLICGHAIKSGVGIKRYFKDAHSKTLYITSRKALVEYDGSLSLIDPDHISIPSPDSPVCIVVVDNNSRERKV